MKITRLSVQNFRNHQQNTVQWLPHLNVIIGPNGAGKTSLIDAIHYLCMSRSFVSKSDQYVIYQGETYFRLIGYFEGNIRTEFEVGCNYSKGEGKKIFVNDGPLDRLSDLIGIVPVVVLSPDDKKLTREGPTERRRFLDSFISQISKEYLRNLLEYSKVRKQRNSLLQQFSGAEHILEMYIEPWNKQLVEIGSKIIAKRYKILQKFKEYLAKDYTMISGMNLTTNLEYKTFCDASLSEAEIQQQYYNKIEHLWDKEIERMQTLVGPHRDEITFYLGNRELRQYGSQGQHRLFALSLKLAQLHFYSDELDDLPIFMLDDVFGDLDPGKTRILLEALQKHPGQIFITAANPVPFQEFINFDGVRNQMIKIEDAVIFMEDLH